MFGTIIGSPWGGLVAAMCAGALVALVLGFFAITYFVDQVIVGVVLNVLVIGLTSLPLRPGAHREPRGSQLPAALRADPDPGARRHPGHRSGAVPPDHPGLHHVRRRGARRLGALPHQVGPARARRR
ncbi:hypothetical protein [Nocardioides convexus]|uniref:hypothetical protein n=1 Tax=Nocardioides convexus TaxID=2712224 RepID=UPI002418B9E6|nr:hypothetical protein [Nocardioides convexus]